VADWSGVGTAVNMAGVINPLSSGEMEMERERCRTQLSGSWGAVSGF